MMDFGSLVNALSNFKQQTAPTITPEYQNLGNMVRSFAERRLGQGSALPPGYEQTQMGNINRGYENANAATDQRIAEQGLSGSPAAAAIKERLETSRAGDLNRFRAETPLLERNLANQDEGLASQILGQFGRGESTSGESSSRTSTTGYQNSVANTLFSQFMNSLANQQTQQHQSSGLCCFIFLEANDGVLDPVVRWYRDAHVSLRSLRGYYKAADVLVPLMRKYSLVRGAVRWGMTKPMTSWARWYYGRNRWGWVLGPVTKFWLGLFDYLGAEHAFLREKSEGV
jgi:hypothetical protein